MADSNPTTWIDITTLKLWDRNPNEGDIGKIVSSISQHGYNDTCHLWNGIVKAGNHSIMALTNLRTEGWHPDKCKTTSGCLRVDGDVWQVAMLDISDMSEIQSDAFGIAINKSQRDGSWNEPELVKLLQEIAISPVVALESTLFDAEELDDLLRDLAADKPAEDSGAQVDRAAELNKKWKVERGQIWQISKHRIMCGDSTCAEDVALLMGGVKADAVVTDPPYGINQPGVPNDEPEKLSGLINGVIDNLPLDNGVIVCFQSTRTFTTWLDITRANGIKFERMLWMYKAAQMTFPWRGWILTSESILVSTIGNGQWNEVKPYSHDCYYMSELSNELPKDSGWHGSVKPLHVVRDLIKRTSKKKQVIYDPFLGSGTMLLAAEMENRTCYGLEISPEYCSVILQRMSDFGLTPELLHNQTEEGR